MILQYLRTLRRLRGELAAAQAEIERLRVERDTALLVSWVRRQPADPVRPLPRRHPVHPGRHRLEAITEVFTRRKP